jgi:hypothetical protein
MVKPYDLFKIDSSGIVWVGDVESFAEAERKAKAVHKREPSCDFCVLDQRTGEKQNIPRTTFEEESKSQSSSL